MSKFKLEKGFPIPEHRTGSGTRSKYPLKIMQVGESFFIPTDTGETAFKTRTSVYARSAQLRKELSSDFKVTIQKVKGRLRVWRVK